MRGTLLLLLTIATMPAAGALTVAVPVPEAPTVVELALPVAPIPGTGTGRGTGTGTDAVVSDLPAAAIPSPQPIVHPIVEALPEIPLDRPIERPPARVPLADTKAERLDHAEAISARSSPGLPDARLQREPATATLLSAGATPFATSAPTPAARRADETPPAAGERAPPAPRSAQTPWRAVAAASSAALVLALLAPLLYHRVRGKALVSGQRAQLLALLRETPALTAADVARHLAVDPSTALYHLRILVREHLVQQEGRHYFAAGTTATAEERAQLVATRSARDVLDAIRARPGVGKTALAQELAIARASVTHHVERLAKAGLVRYEKEGRSLRIFAKESLS